MAVECANVIVYEHGGGGGFDMLGVLPIAIAGMLIGVVAVDALTGKTIINL